MYMVYDIYIFRGIGFGVVFIIKFIGIFIEKFVKIYIKFDKY